MTSKLSSICSPDELRFLVDFSKKFKFSSTLLPIQSVGVQGDCRSYSYVVALSEDDIYELYGNEEKITQKFDYLARIAKLIPRVCHNINRVCYIFGREVKEPVYSVTHTTLTPMVIEQLREADHIATSELMRQGYGRLVSQMPIILIPIHFDREEGVTRLPSAQRSVVIRTFITEDFMTGVPAIPNKHIPYKVNNRDYACLLDTFHLLLVSILFSFIYSRYSFSKKLRRRSTKFLAFPACCTTSRPNRRVLPNGNRECR